MTGPVASLLLASVIWGASFGLVKHGLPGFPPAFVATVRLAGAFVVFAAFWRPAAVAPALGLRLAGLGAVQYGLMYLLYLGALARLPAYVVAAGTAVVPLLVVACDDAWSRRLRAGAWLLALAAAAGAAITGGWDRVALPALRWAASGGGLGEAGAAPAVGLAMLMGSNLCFAAGQVAYRRWRPLLPAGPDLPHFAWLYLGAAVVSGAGLAATGGGTPLPPVGLPEVAILAYLAVVASGLAFFLWNRAAPQVPIATLATLNNLKVPLAVAISILAFGEHADLTGLLLGGGLIVAAAVASRWRAA